MSSRCLPAVPDDLAKRSEPDIPTARFQGLCLCAYAETSAGGSPQNLTGQDLIALFGPGNQKFDRWWMVTCAAAQHFAGAGGRIIGRLRGGGERACSLQSGSGRDSRDIRARNA
jgi:hypothetical protein